MIGIWDRAMDWYECKMINNISGARPDFEATVAVEVSGLDDPSDRGKCLSRDGIDYTFDCAGGTI